MKYTGTLTKTEDGYSWAVKDVFEWEISGAATLTSTTPPTFALTDTSHKVPAMVFSGAMSKDGAAYAFTIKTPLGWSISGTGKVQQRSPLIIEMEGEVGPIPKAFHVPLVDDLDWVVA